MTLQQERHTPGAIYTFYLNEWEMCLKYAVIVNKYKAVQMNVKTVVAPERRLDYCVIVACTE